MDSSTRPIDRFSDSGKAIHFGQDISRCVLRCKLGLTIHRPLNTHCWIAPQQTALTHTLLRNHCTVLQMTKIMPTTGAMLYE